MISKKLLFTIIFFFSITIISVTAYLYFTNQKPALAAGSTITALSCSQDDVQEAITSASVGDTVAVPAGNCTWTSTLNITSKSVNLIGAGIGNTVITAAGSSSVLIQYSAASSGVWMRVSGFSFNANNGRVIRLLNNGRLPVNNIRIDHNRFYNSTYKGAGISFWSVSGVIDHNTFDTMGSPIRSWGTNYGVWDWDNMPELVWGGSDNMYVEDNTITDITYMVSDQDEGGKYVFRYNTISTPSVWPFFDVHASKASIGLHGGMGGEIYGNKITGSGYLVSQRGGRVTAHHNNLTGGGTVNIYDNDGCPSVEKEKINNSYHFINRTNSSGSGSLLTWSSSGGDTCGGVVVENATFWMDNNSCVAPNTCSNIITGTGCGTLANRPTSCTTGVGYWATDQSCSGLSGMVGVNPPTPISGTLYKCTATNTWTAYYTPYTYPHPLTVDSTPPPSQNFSPNQIIEAESGQISAPIQTGVSGSDTYVYTPSVDNTGSVKFNFNISQSGQYKLEAKANSNNDGGQNSFYVGLDNELAQGNALYAYNIFPLAAGFVWDEISKWGNGTTSPQFDPMTWNLTSGTHSFTFYGRESNTWLDQIRLVSATTDTTPPSAPSGLVVQ